jgi:hypothetical protein
MRRASIRAAGIVVDFLDVFQQQLILLGAGGAEPGSPFVVALAAHTKDPAGHRDVEPVVGQFMDQRENYFGRTFSRSK